MSATGTALTPSQKPSLPPWILHVVSGVIVAIFTWMLATNRMDAVQETRLSTIEKSVDGKASKESVDGIEKRLDRIEGKLDKALERHK